MLNVKSKFFRISIVAVIALLFLLVVMYAMLNTQKHSIENEESGKVPETVSPISPKATRYPLEGKTIYRDDMRLVTLTEKEYRDTNRVMDADALKVVSREPGTTWLVGPNSSDPTAQKDIQTVIRTSLEAANQGTTPVYQLYAIPHRDACAEYSKGGFNTPKEYANWINQIVTSVKTPSVFLVETDSIGNIASKNCLSQLQVREREQLLKTTVEKLRQSPNALSIYIDAAHSEWFPDPTVLVGPLKRSGFDSTDGIFVNTSFFVETKEISRWSKTLLDILGGEKGVIIDTGRNGNGKPLQNLTGEARWCNPDGRSIGTAPSTQTGVPYIHAYLWIKNIGESDGSCAGYPSAGTFVPELALKLVRNRS